MNGKFGGGNGNSASPYLIEDADDLNAIRNYPSSYFKLVNDINFGKTKYISGQGWNPIRNFTGVFDGNNHKLINFYINRPTEDYVGLFKTAYTFTIKNVYFIDVNITGRDCVGTVLGYVMNDANNFQNALIYNMFVSGKINGRNHVSGVIGAVCAFMRNFINPFVSICADVEIEAEDACAYGIAFNGNDALVGSIYGNCYGDCKPSHNCTSNCGLITKGEIYTDCGNGNWSNNQSNNQYSVTFQKCFAILHKNPRVSTYYGISNVHSVFSGCYVDNSEHSPIISSGIEYRNLVNINYEKDIVINIDNGLYKKFVGKKIEPLNLNQDSIYFKTDEGYTVYNFETQEWELKYTNFNNNNSAKIILDGMNRNDLIKIPSNKLKELCDKNSKIKIVNCIQAHEKIVSKSETVEVNKFKEFVNKNVFKNKIKFNKYNDKIMSIVKQ